MASLALPDQPKVQSIGISHLFPEHLHYGWIDILALTSFSVFITESQLIPGVDISAVTAPTRCLELDVSVSIVGTVREAFVAEYGIITLSAVETTECRTD